MIKDADSDADSDADDDANDDANDDFNDDDDLNENDGCTSRRSVTIISSVSKAKPSVLSK